jgi:aspartate aminotransferase
MSDPTWGNHHLIFDLACPNVKQRFYPYFDAAHCRIDFDGMISTLEAEAQAGDLILLHACAHNPTGLDPTHSQWQTIADLCESKNLFVFFDSAYQGFASGDADADAWAVRHFVERSTMELCVAQSFSKNFGLYGQRVGAFHLVTSTPHARERAHGLLSDLQRGEISMPPIYGARIVNKILRDADLLASWKRDLTTMADRIKGMRKALFDELVRLQTPGSWKHIVEQTGMFSYTGLSEEQVGLLKEKHVYMLLSGRASISGLNERNTAVVARVVDEVVRKTGEKPAEGVSNAKTNGHSNGHANGTNGAGKENVHVQHTDEKAVESKAFANVDA